MPKTCTYTGCTHNVFSKGLCRTHWGQQYSKPLKRTPIKRKGYAANSSKPRKAIKKVADKRAKQLRIYSKLRSTILTPHTQCQMQLPGCTYIATELHHKEGRENELLIKEDNLLPCCSSCHRKATVASKEAIEAGISTSRIKPVIRPNFNRT